MVPKVFECLELSMQTVFVENKKMFLRVLAQMSRLSDKILGSFEQYVRVNTGGDHGETDYTVKKRC